MIPSDVALEAIRAEWERLMRENLIGVPADAFARSAPDADGDTSYLNDTMEASWTICLATVIKTLELYNQHLRELAGRRRELDA